MNFPEMARRNRDGKEGANILGWRSIDLNVAKIGSLDLMLGLRSGFFFC